MKYVPRQRRVFAVALITTRQKHVHNLSTHADNIFNELILTRLKNAVDGELYGEEFAEAVAQDGKPQHLRRQASYYMQMINWAAWHLARINAVEAAQEIAQSKVELDALLLRMKGD